MQFEFEGLGHYANARWHLAPTLRHAEVNTMVRCAAAIHDRLERQDPSAGVNRMAFHITHRYGVDTSNPPLVSLSELLRELDSRPQDTEHGSVSLTHESAWCLSVSRGGYVIFEHLEDGGERHKRGVPDAKIVEMWSKLARGDITSLNEEPWTPGYG